MSYIGLAVVLIVLILLILLFSYIPLGLWISALAAGVNVGIFTLEDHVRYRHRGVEESVSASRDPFH